MSGFDGKNFIGGEWRPAASGRRFEQRNPAFLHEVTGTFADSAAADVDAAIAAAQRAFPAWRALSPLKRKAYLDHALRAMIARRDEIAAVITRENGKALREARGEVDSAIKEMDYQIAEGVRLCGQTVPVEVERHARVLDARSARARRARDAVEFSVQRAVPQGARRR